MIPKPLAASGLFLCLACISLIGGGEETPGPEAKADSLIQALQEEDRIQAASVLNGLPPTLPPAEIQKIIEALNRLNPGGDWIPFLQSLDQKYGQNAHIAFLLGRAYWRAGNVDAAIQQCHNALQIAPQDVQLLYQCAAVAQTLGKNEEAKTWLSELLALQPEDPDGLFLLGRIHAAEGQGAEAEPLLQRAVQANPRHYLAYYELGRLKNQAGQYEEAEKNFREAVKFYPFFREAYNALLTTLARLQKNEALQAVKAVAVHMSSWDDIKEGRLRYSFFHPAEINLKDGYELATELCFVNRRDLARKYLELKLREGQANEPILFLLSQLRFQDGDYTGCLTLQNQLQHPRAVESQIFAEERAWSLFQLGRVEAAQTYLTEALSRFPDSKPLQALAKKLEAEKQKHPETSPNLVESASAPLVFRFVDVTEKTGLTAFKHTQGNPDKRWIIDAMGSGVAVADYDRDGDDDIYFVNARPDYARPQPEYRNAMFRNDGGRFVDVTDAAGLGDMGYGMAAVFGDIDNDGWLDLFVGNYGPDALYRNNGDGTFTDITHTAGINEPGYTGAAAFADINGDGWLDLFVGNYVAFDPQTDGQKQGIYHGIRVMGNPLAYAHQDDHLYINQRDGTFRDTSAEAGINVSEGRAMGSAVFDIEDDGDLDLYVSIDSAFNYVLLNRGNGIFEDISFYSGAAFNEEGVAGGDMGVSLGDFNNDGRLDLFVTSYETMSDVLYRNDGEGRFTDVTAAWGLGFSSYWLITWGSGFGDFDADGYLDLYTANGHLYPQVDQLGLGRKYKQGLSIYRNLGQKYEDVSTRSFPGGLPAIGGRGSALLDFDNDGDLDIIVNCVDSTPLLLENQTPQGHWLKVTLAAPSADCFGVKVTARKEDRIWTRIIDGGSSYLSQNSQTLHFGFGEIDSIDELIIHWRGREAQIIPSPALNQHLKIQPDPPAPSPR
ncbi:MAG TPA: FG-GAP-like repeat-containing protein [bacterium]|nr:FG-GAP-like repeat-containing protein [bacterium]